MANTNSNMGWHSIDGTFEQHVDWGYEIEFIYKEKEYHIEKKPNGSILVITWEGEIKPVKSFSSLEEFMNGKLFNRTVKWLIKNVRFTGIH